ncbi:carbohydrate-binding protein [Streptomyces vinaceus]|uniref:carbohydrate-binding protein n=1 Tax=Streptomyces vinaceus TaxID=1960 RepID=UPI00381E7A8D
MQPSVPTTQAPTAPPAKRPGTPAPAPSYEALTPIHAVDYARASDTPEIVPGPDLDRVVLRDGTWLGYGRIDFGCAPLTRFLATVDHRLPEQGSGQVEVRSGAPTGELLGRIAIGGPGGDRTSTVSTDITPVCGIHEIYLVFTSGQQTAFARLASFSFDM